MTNKNYPQLKVLSATLSHALASYKRLNLVQGRGKRWRRQAVRLTQATTALLIISRLTLMPAYAAGSAFTPQTAGDNPFNNVYVGNNSTPSFADIDGDGDLDAFIGEYYGTIKYYKNTGTALAPAFSEQTGANNPLNGVDVAYDSAASFADIDGDGDLDAFIGKNYGTINYYKNTGTPLAPTFSEQTSTANPFNGVDVGSLSTPSFVDIDGDGDLDAFIGEYDGSINYYQNTGTPLAPIFSEQSGAANPFDGQDVGDNSTPSFADIDGDGDLDAFIGEYDGIINYYKNTGTPLAPTFSEQTTTNNPFNGVDVGYKSTPSFADIDNDGDLDAFIGEYYGTIKYYKNTGTLTIAPTLKERTGSSNAFNGVDVDFNSTPSFADIDGDGDWDAFIGDFTGTIKYYKNTGTTLVPTFSEQTGTDNPFNNVDVGYRSTPSFADIDGDGDLDAFIGEYDVTINYYQNTGTPLAPTFSEQTGVNNPFNSVDVAYDSTPSFADIDRDGDLDAFIGEQYGSIYYYKNIGTALVPAFSLETGGNNPLNSVDVGNNSTPSFADIDGDGDLDAFIGEYDGSINYYKNTGTALVPAFSLETGGNNPLNVNVSLRSTPSFADIDGDGDLDAFIGTGPGTINYYENTHCSFTSEMDSSIAAGDVMQFGNGNSKVLVKVNTLGSLTSLSFACVGSNHANSAGAENTEVYWTITPNAGASGFNVDMTLPYKNPDDDDRVCRYTGVTRMWDCTVNSRSATDITRTGITEFSDWAVGDGDLGALMVELASFTAENQENGIRISWQTISEQDNLGFNLYRASSIDGNREQLNSSFIPAEAPGSGQGAEYEYIDETAEEGLTYYYWLEDVAIDGQKSLHGPISYQPNAPTAVTLSHINLKVPTFSLSLLISLMFSLLMGSWAWQRKSSS